MNINVVKIPQSKQRYQTCGDWWFDERGDLQIRVSALENEYYEWFIAQHEINEALMCKNHKISEKSVTDFDIQFEKLRSMYPLLIGGQEPGHMDSAPYTREHKASEYIERTTVSAFGMDWEQYSNAIDNTL